MHIVLKVLTALRLKISDIDERQSYLSLSRRKAFVILYMVIVISI